MSNFYGSFFYIISWSSVASVCGYLRRKPKSRTSTLEQLLPSIFVEGNCLEHVYLGSNQSSDGCCTPDVKRRIASVMISVNNVCVISDCAFPVAAARSWNSLPPGTRACSSLLTFQKETKSYLFRQSYDWLVGAVHSDGQQTSALSCATVLDVDFVKCPHNRVMTVLGVVLDSSLTFDQHVRDTVRNCNFHLRALRHIRPSLTSDVANTIACSIIGWFPVGLL